MNSSTGRLLQVLKKRYSNSPRLLHYYDSYIRQPFTNKQIFVAAVVTVGIVSESRRYNSFHRVTSSDPKTQLEGPNDGNKDKKQQSSDSAGDSYFDVTETLDKVKMKLLGSSRGGDSSGGNQTEKGEGKNGQTPSSDNGFFDTIQHVFAGITGGHDDKSEKKKRKSNNNDNMSFTSMGKTLNTLLSSKSNHSIDDVVTQVRDMNGRGDVQDQTSMMEVFYVAKRCAEIIDTKLDAFFGEDGPPPVYLPSWIYFVEKEDERKNPSWKRRKHRFFPGIDMDMMDECYEKLLLAQLGYADTVQQIKDELKNDYNSELVFCALESLPNKPAHFVAVKRDQSDGVTNWRSS